MKNLFKFIVVVAVFVLITVICNAEEKNYEFVSINGLTEQMIAEKMLKDIYNKLGIVIKINPVPGERAKLLATTGQVDGETLRIFSYGEKNKMMIRIPTPYSSLETTVFAKKSKNVSIKTKEDLLNYKIVIVRGVQHTKDITDGIKNVHVIDNSELMMKFINAERADIAITNKFSGNTELKKLGLNDIIPVITLETLDLFHYLHEKNKDVVTKVNTVIKDMTASGELKSLREKYEKELLNSN